MSTKNDVTIYDIAKVLEISPATVSRALNDVPLVSKGTRDKIVKMARDLGYRQNIFASSLRSHRTNFIGAVVPQLSTYFASNIVSGAEMAANQSGYNLVLSQSMNNPELQIANIENLNRRRVDGLLITSFYSQRPASLQNRATQLGIPTVVLEGSVLLPQAKKATANFEIAYELTDQLIKKGCKRIVYVCARADRSPYVDLKRGYQQALHDNGLPENEEHVLVGYKIGQLNMQACRRILSMDPRPDGFIFSDQVMTAVSIPEFATAENNSRQETLSIDDSPLFTYTDNALAAVGHQILEQGRVAAILLICLIEQADMHRKTA